MNESIFHELDRVVGDGDIAKGLALAGHHFRQQRRYHEMFELRKMQLRHQLGYPVLSSTSLDEPDLDEERQQRLERGLINACREIGYLLMKEGKIREAWMYLRAVG